MFAKVVTLVLSMGILAAALLAIRQQRIQAAHDLADSQRRLVEHDRTLWRLRLEIAARVTPARVEAAGARLGRLEAIRTERYAEMLVRAAALDAGEVTFAVPEQDE